MPTVPLTLGFYKARSVIAEAQRCVNLFPESNPQDAPYPYTLYSRPGLSSLSVPPNSSRGRGLYTSSQGELFACVGGTLYFVDSGWQFHALGTVPDGMNPLSFMDNGLDLVVATGRPKVGYQVDLLTHQFTQITDPAWLGAVGAGFVDTFSVFTDPLSQTFYSSLSNEIAFDPTYIAKKTGAPDPIVTLAVVHREIWLLGSRTTEVWFNNGGALFPFGEISGVFIQHGCAAPYSVVTHGLQLYWLGTDKDGNRIVFLGAEYQAKRISTYAMEHEFASYPQINDAIGMILQMQGHLWYVLTFPSADKTWVFDMMEGMWHEWTWTDLQGAEHRHRVSSIAFAYDTHVGMDWATGELYALDMDLYDDNRTPIVYRRGFPHLYNQSDRVSYSAFTAVMSTGEVPGGIQYKDLFDFNGDFNGDFDIFVGDTYWPIDPQVSLRWSDNGGKSWSNPIEQSLGSTGEYLTTIQWNRLGMARDRVFELFWSAPVRTALSGAVVDILPLGS